MRRDDWLVGQLPMGMLDDDFFVRFVSLFQDVASTLMAAADNIPNVVDVTVAPPELVRWLGSWIGVTSIDASLPDELQRRIVRDSGRALAWRGTCTGLRRTLEAITGAPVTVEESGGIAREGEFGVRTPWVHVGVSSTGWLTEADLVALVSDEVPVNVALEVRVDDRRIWRHGDAAATPLGGSGPAPAEDRTAGIRVAAAARSAPPGAAGRTAAQGADESAGPPIGQPAAPPEPPGGHR